MKTVQQGIISNIQLGASDTYQVSIHLPSFLGDIIPGQFVQISTPGKFSTLLKRPISVYGYKNNYLELLFKVVGSGTSNLSMMKIGQSVDLILPLGNSFTPPKTYENVLLIGGGMGIAPLTFYVNYYHSRNPTTKFYLYYGITRKTDELSLTFPVPFPGELKVHTDYHNEQLVGNLLDFYKNNPASSYHLVISCGPSPMMKSFAKFFKDYSMKMEVSLESMMACGFGVCLGCAFLTEEGSKTVCSDGPVFASNIINWEKIWNH